MDTTDTRIPVTLLTGFLGAGKTTLLNHLINDPEAGRIAVIMNEFGAAGLDHDLIEASTEETILMQSGCLCCTFRGDISKTLGSLMASKNRGELDFERIVIETTGIADPAPILHTLVMDDLSAPYFRMDGVVTLADAAAGPATLDAHSEAVSQIAMADRIVVTKTDLVSEDDVAAFETRLADLNSRAKTIIADRGVVPVGSLFGISAMREDVSAEDIAAWIGVSSAPQDAADGKSPQARHDHRITSASIEIDAPISANAFDFWLDMLLAFNGPDILRIKGIVHVDDMPWPFVFHGVQHIFDAPVPLKNWTGPDKKTRVVVIARNMDKEELRESLNMLLMQPKEVVAAANDLIPDAAEMPF